jgi:hypothetical protein
MLRSWFKIKWRIKSWGRHLLNRSRKAGPTKEICGDLGLFLLHNIPLYHFAAPVVDHQVDE